MWTVFCSLLVLRLIQIGSRSIDWRHDGNLFLLGDYYRKPKIYDLRAGKIAKIYDKWIIGEWSYTDNFLISN
mgnify:CR=1 FL=1